MLALPDLGRHIARRRRSLKLTQAELARRARVGRVTLDALENGRSGELGFVRIGRILAALGLELRLTEVAGARPTLDDLLADDDD
jgi:transcriptional regulator with XRE-family HTH domain